MMRSRPLGPSSICYAAVHFFFMMCVLKISVTRRTKRAMRRVMRWWWGTAKRTKRPNTASPHHGARTGHITVCDFGHMNVFRAAHRNTPDYMTLPFLSLLPHLNGIEGEAGLKRLEHATVYPIIICECDRILWLDGFYELCEDL